MSHDVIRPTLLVPVRDRAHFREIYFQKGGLGGLFVKGGLDLTLGEDVDLEITFLDEQDTFRIRGGVRWRRQTTGRRSLPPGVGVEFSPAEEKTRNLLLDYAMGKEVSMVHREDRRVGASLTVDVKQGALKSRDHTDDISAGGAFVLSEDLIPIGEMLDLTLRVPGKLFGLGVKAKVAWHRTEGRRGFGVEFVFDSARKKEQVEKLVAKLKGQMLQELKVRVPHLRAQ